MVRGNARIGVGDQELTLGAGQAAVLQPGQDHELLGASEDLELYVFALQPELAAREREPLAGAAGVASFAERELRPIVDALRGLGDVVAPEAIEAGVLAVWSSVCQRTRPPAALARRAYSLLKSERSTAQASLAERLNTSPSELSRSFHRSFGVSLVQYRSRLRLLEFIRLVDAGEPVTRAALDADFGSYAQCFRVFQRSLACSPREYFAGARREIDRRLR